MLTYLVACLIFHDETKMAVSSANSARCVFSFLGMSFKYKLNSIGPSTDPWGTPANMACLVELD